jgi:hypothetical protein
MKFNWFRQQREAERDTEIRHQLDEAIRARLARGETPEQARANALCEFGKAGLVKETTRAMWGWSWLEQLMQDLRFGARMLLKQRGFTLIAVLTLALGIGATTAIFTVVNAVLLQPLPYRQADRLVAVSLNDNNGEFGNTGYATFVDWQARAQSFAQLALLRSWGGTLTGQGEPENVAGLRVTPDYFKLLGVAPALGRDFRGADDRPDTRSVVILSHALWQRRFQSDPHVIGKPLVLSGRAFTVIGVMPQGFEDWLAAHYERKAELWAALGYDVTEEWACRGCQHLKAFGRLKDGVTLDQARTEMNTIAAALQQEYPREYSTPTAFVAGLQEEFVKGIRPALYLLLIAVGDYDRYGFHIEEKPWPNPADAPSVQRYGISPDYLRTMRIGLLRGRGFMEQDKANAPLVALLNQTTARRYWPHEDPLGKRVRLGDDKGPLRTIVGIVPDVAHYGLEDAPDAQVYVPSAQWANSSLQLAVRTTADTTSVVAAIRREVSAVDKDIPLYQIATMEQLMATTTAQRRFTLLLAGVFAGLSLVLAGLGIYSVMAYAVAERTHEIGLRMALGAQTGDVLRLVIGQGMTLVLLGVAAGMTAAFGLTRLMKALLFEVKATDPLTFAAVAALLALVAFVACWLPARRATKVDPLVALRTD